MEMVWEREMVRVPAAELMAVMFLKLRATSRL